MSRQDPAQRRGAKRKSPATKPAPAAWPRKSLAEWLDLQQRVHALLIGEEAQGFAQRFDLLSKCGHADGEFVAIRLWHFDAGRRFLFCRGRSLRECGRDEQRGEEETTDHLFGRRAEPARGVFENLQR